MIYLLICEDIIAKRVAMLSQQAGLANDVYSAAGDEKWVLDMVSF